MLRVVCVQTNGVKTTPNSGNELTTSPRRRWAGGPGYAAMSSVFVCVLGGGSLNEFIQPVYPLNPLSLLILMSNDILFLDVSALSSPAVIRWFLSGGKVLKL